MEIKCTELQHYTKKVINSIIKGKNKSEKIEN